jgi:monoamine oxidase
MQVKEHFDIIIIGAGASGLLAAVELTQVKLKILILEAQHRIGGRMYTNLPEDFTGPIECGAEFIHGDAPITLSILQDAKAAYTEMSGNVYQAHEENVEKEDFFDHEWKLVLDHLERLEADTTMSEFLTRTFPDKKYDGLKQKITKFIEGYNAADVTKVSSLALRDEWSEEEDPAQYRINGGYEKLYNYLKSQIETQGGIIKVNHKVQEVRWNKGEVEVRTNDGMFQARQCLVTLPVSLLKTDAIKFEPAVPHVAIAAGNIGFGGVIKINLEFKKRFWETEPKRKFKDVQFIFTDEAIPTWWSQSPNERPLLTGWLGGPRAEQLNQSDEDILKLAISSLANAMDYPEKKVKEQLIAYRVDQWVSNEFSRGAYSYEMVNSAQAITALERSIEETLFFAGEAIYNGPHKGTVEAALTSGRDAAKRILKSKNLF